MSLMETDVAVVGAGPAGCAAALGLRRAGLHVTLIERQQGSPDRFCGEFLAGEAAEALEGLGALETLLELDPIRVRRMALYSRRGQAFEMGLTGFGVARPRLDPALLELFVSRGGHYVSGVDLESIEGDLSSGFTLTAKDGLELRTRAVVGAWGKRSTLDRRLGRRFLSRRTGFVGVKARYSPAPRSDRVALYSFQGGYCGLTSVEANCSTLGFLALEETLREAGGRPLALIETARRQSLALDSALAECRLIADSVSAIGQVPLIRKEPEKGGVLFVGDCAGITAPFLGVGVTNALRSGVAAAECLSGFLLGRATAQSALRSYRLRWNREIGRVQRWSFLLSSAMCNPTLTAGAVRLLRTAPSLGQLLYGWSRPSTLTPSTLR